MIIGTVKEIKDMEYRVGLTPAGASDYVAAGHQVLLEKGAGEGSGFPDEAYREGGGCLGAFRNDHQSQRADRV